MAAHQDSFDSFKLLTGKSLNQTYIFSNAGVLLRILQDVIGKPLNSAQQERLGKLLMERHLLKDRPTRNTENETLKDMIRNIERKLDGHQTKAQAPQKPLSPAEFRKAVGYIGKPENVTYWCRIGELKAHKLDPDNPKSPWRIEATEVNRYLEKGGISVPSNKGKNAERRARDKARSRSKGDK
ncbi:MAG: hypothetical protein JNL96_00760 [Planctomycetaceae bacterium]|nr:hypothetical protein [Planctomycetaceae bacterium]